jgi:putative transposase
MHVDTTFLTMISALITVEHDSRRTHLIGAWITQAARNLLMNLGDRVTTVKFLLRDGDSWFTRAFDAVFAAEGIRILTSPPRAPVTNAICERMIGTLRRDLLNRILIVNERHLRRILHSLPASCQRSAAIPSAGATRTGPSRDPTPTGTVISTV